MIKRIQEDRYWCKDEQELHGRGMRRGLQAKGVIDPVFNMDAILDRTANRGMEEAARAEIDAALSDNTMHLANVPDVSSPDFVEVSSALKLLSQQAKGFLTRAFAGSDAPAAIKMDKGTTTLGFVFDKVCSSFQQCLRDVL